jgi:hypothetical protein
MRDVELVCPFAIQPPTSTSGKQHPRLLLA